LSHKKVFVRLNQYWVDLFETPGCYCDSLAGSLDSHPSVTLHPYYGILDWIFNSLVSVTTKSNLPQNEPLKWNLRKAAVEFGTTVDTLKKSLNQVSAEPDADGLYTSGQLIQARYGELYQEKLRVHRETADRIALENAITRGETLSRSELMKGFAALADAMVHRIMVSGLSKDAQSDLLKDLASIPVVIADTAKKQSRFRPANGEKRSRARSQRLKSAPEPAVKK
jgi:hypothetical protein